MPNWGRNPVYIVRTSSTGPATDPRAGLLPEGSRWGRGAHSVVPYLVATRAPTGDTAPAASEPPIRNPVFPRMELLLTWGGH